MILISIDITGAILQHYNYTAFGNATLEAGSDSLNFPQLFHGEYYDNDTGLSNYGYRYYSPILGRWLSRDPIGERGGINLYEFVGNNALKLIDNFGLIIVPILIFDFDSPCNPDKCKDYTAEELQSVKEAQKTATDLQEFYFAGKTLQQYKEEHGAITIGAGGSIIEEEIVNQLPPSVRDAFYEVEMGIGTYAAALELSITSLLRYLITWNSDAIWIESARIEANRQTQVACKIYRNGGTLKSPLPCECRRRYPRFPLIFA